MLLQIERLTKKYKSPRGDILAVNEAYLQIDYRELVCLTGRSGSGKSTLLSMIAGLTSPTSGSIRLEGKPIASLKDKALSRLRNSTIGYIPQGKSILKHLTVLDNVRLPYYLSNRPGDPTENALQLLERVGLSRYAKKLPTELSGGELRRVTIARALINQPKLILADEPTGDLDEQNALEILELFSAIAKSGTAILMVTHDKELVAYGTRHLSMSQGKLNEVSIQRYHGNVKEAIP